MYWCVGLCRILSVTKNKYLYGDVDVPEIDALVVARRIELLDDHLTEVMNVPPLKRNQNQANAIIKAISFWSSINKEESI